MSFKRNPLLISIISLGMLFFLLHSGHGQESATSGKEKKEPLSKWAKQWLEEVVPYIISPEEKETFVNLPNERERGKFIESFWRARDPDPGTSENEFKTEYYRRIAFANKFLGTSAIPGWRTDRGRIYILLGPPNEIQQDFSPSNSFSSPFPSVTEVWSYQGLPGTKLPYNLDLMFGDKFGTGDYVLISNTGFGDLSSMHYRFDYMENLAEVMKAPYESLKKLQGIVTTQVTYDLIPLESRAFYMKGSGNRTFMPLIIEIPYAKLPHKMIEGQYYFSLTLIINVSNKLGQIVHQRSKDIHFRHSQAEYASLNSKDFQIQAFLSLEPETYRVHLLVADNFSGKIGTLHQEMTVPELRKQGLGLSNIILLRREYDQDRRLSARKKSHFEDIFSELNHIFHPDQKLNIYFEIYNLALNQETGRNKFSVEYFLYQNAHLAAHIPSSRSNTTKQKDCCIQTSLRLKNYNPGEYTLRIRVVDMISGRTADRDVQFIIAD